MSRARVLLLACLLVACHSRQGTLALAVQHSQLYDLTPIGISFVPSESAQQQQQQQDQQQQPAAAPDDGTRPNGGQPPESSEQLERVNIILAPGLSELSADDARQQQQEHRDLTKRTYSRDSVIRELIKLIDDSLKARLTHEISAPIIRNGRTFPSPISAVDQQVSNSAHRQQQQQPAARDAASLVSGGIRWQQAEPDEALVDQDGASVVPSHLIAGKSRFLGLKYNGPKPGAQSAAAPYHSGNQRQHRQAAPLFASSSSAATGQSSAAAAAPSANYNSNNNNRNHPTPSPALYEAMSSFNHRHGSEEVALHAPLHPLPDSDFEFKRVENSRWNNLRGMWGKRAISERYNNLENFKNMLETEARESVARGDSSGDNSANNNDANDGRQQQQQRAAM